MALAQGWSVSDQALTLIQQNVDRYSADDFADDAEEQQMIRELFRIRPGLYARFSEMQQNPRLRSWFDTVPEPITVPAPSVRVVAA